MREYIYCSDGKPLANEHNEILLARKEIVRCRDCVNYEPNDYIHFTCEYLQVHTESNDYCAWGERTKQ